MNGGAFAAWCGVAALLVVATPAGAQKVGDASSGKAPVVVPDSTGTGPAAAGDSLAVRLPPSFAPDAPAHRSFLVPVAALSPDSLALLSLFDVFLLPPLGPTSFYDRTDLRLAERADGWEIMRDAAAAFVLPAGYPGTSSPLSFRGRGAAGTKLVFGRESFGGPARPQESLNAVARGPLSGLAVLPVSGAHLYGPGAGAGAVHFLGTAQAPTRAFSEAATRSGVFGQSGGSMTAASRYGRLGVLINYDANRARAWSLFGGLRAERYHARLDYVRGGWRVAATGRLIDEKLKGFLPPNKWGEEGGAVGLAIEGILGPTTRMAVRAGRERHLLRADGASGVARDHAWSTWADAVLTHETSHFTWGVLGVWTYERRTRSGGGVRRTTRDHGGALLLRGVAHGGPWRLDCAVRADRMPSGQEVVAPGLTASWHPGSSGVVWGHVGRVVDRPVLGNGVTDFYAQVNQGIDLALGGEGDLETGVGSALGVRWSGAAGAVELGVSGERVDRRLDSGSSGLDAPLDPTRGSSTRIVAASMAATWATLLTGPIDLGALGSLRFFATGTVSSHPEGGSDAYVPRRHARSELRLRRDFGRSLRLEGAMLGEAMSSMSGPRGDIPAQGQLGARLALRIQDIVVFYRAENVLGSKFRTSAFDVDTGFAPTTTRNINLGLSWVLVD